MDNKEQQPQEEYSYPISPASQINLNFDIKELPRCHEKDCQGTWLPVQHTTHPKFLAPTIVIAGWICNECGKNFSFDAGKFYMQTTLIEKEAKM